MVRTMGRLLEPDGDNLQRLPIGLNRIKAGELPASTPPRPVGVERNLVVTVRDGSIQSTTCTISPRPTSATQPSMLTARFMELRSSASPTCRSSILSVIPKPHCLSRCAIPSTHRVRPWPIRHLQAPHILAESNSGTARPTPIHRLPTRRAASISPLRIARRTLSRRIAERVRRCARRSLSTYGKARRLCTELAAGYGIRSTNQEVHFHRHVLRNSASEIRRGRRQFVVVFQQYAGQARGCRLGKIPKNSGKPATLALRKAGQPLL